MAGLVRLIFAGWCAALAIGGLFAPAPAHALLPKVIGYTCARTLLDGTTYSGGGSSLEEACRAGGEAAAPVNGQCPGGGPPGGDTGKILSDGACHHLTNYCPGYGSGLADEHVMGCYSQYQCPPNSEDVGGGSCRCLPGYQQKDAACEQVAAHECPGFGTYIPPEGGDDARYVYPGVEHAGSYCHGGCGEMPEGVATDGSGVGQYSYGGGISTGTACGPNAGAGATKRGPDSPNSSSQDGAPANCKAPTACSGQVNGTTVCVPCGTPTTTSGSQSTSTGADGSATGSSTTQTSTQTNKDGSTTTTTTTTNSDGTSTRTISTSPPGAGGTSSTGGGSNGGGGTGLGGGTCTGTNCGSGSDSFGGSCSASFHCDGDAVQCSIAMEQHQRDCAMFDPASAGGDWADGASKLSQAKADGDRPGWSPASPGNEVATELHWDTSIDHSTQLAAECPADVAIGSTGLVLSLGSICPYFGIVGTFMEAMTLIACMFIVFGVKGGSK